jgi:hypothetical protein
VEVHPSFAWPCGGMHSRLLRYCAFFAGAPLLVAACGGGGSTSTSGAANASTTTTVKGGGSAQGTALRDCLQKQGVTLPAGFGGGGNRPPGGGTPGSFPAGGTPRTLPAGIDQQKFQSALKACGGTGGFPGGGRNSPAFQAYTSCLSDHGVKVPKRTGATTPPTFDRNSATFVAANKVCAALLPTRSTTTTTTTPSS